MSARLAIPRTKAMLEFFSRELHPAPASRHCAADASPQLSSSWRAWEAAVFNRILVPIDLTEQALTMRAVSVAEALAVKFDGDMRLVNIQSLVPISMIDYVPDNFDENIRVGLQNEIAAVAAKSKLPPHRISTAILFGPVYQNILAEARDWSADAIIIGSHRPGKERFLIGSNASAVVRHATCSVLVVR
jgi:nucleotide-binding universal stress UspA family protein